MSDSAKTVAVIGAVGVLGYILYVSVKPFADLLGAGLDAIKSVVSAAGAVPAAVSSAGSAVKAVTLGAGGGLFSGCNYKPDPKYLDVRDVALRTSLRSGLGVSSLFPGPLLAAIVTWAVAGAETFRPTTPSEFVIAARGILSSTGAVSALADIKEGILSAGSPSVCRSRPESSDCANYAYQLAGAKFECSSASSATKQRYRNMANAILVELWLQIFRVNVTVKPFGTL